jgi:hypothetical protein
MLTTLVIPFTSATSITLGNLPLIISLTNFTSTFMSLIDAPPSLVSTRYRQLWIYGMDSLASLSFPLLTNGDVTNIWIYVSVVYHFRVASLLMNLYIEI